MPTPTDQFALPSHEPRPYLRNGRHGGHGRGNRSGTDLGIHPLTVEADDRLIGVRGDVDPHSPHHFDDRRSVGGIHPGPQNGQGGGPVHRARVEIPRRESTGQRARHRGFSGAGWSIDRDDALEAHFRWRFGLGGQACF